MSETWQQHYGAAAGNPWQQYGQSPATSAVPALPMSYAPQAQPYSPHQSYAPPAGQYGSQYGTQLPASAQPYPQPAGWAAPVRPASNQNRNLLVALMAVIVIAAAVVVTVLLTRSSSAAPVGPQQPVTPTAPVTQTTSSAGVRPFPGPISPENPTAPATDAPSTQGPSPSDPQTSDPGSSDPGTDTPSTSDPSTSDSGNAGDQGAALAAAKTFAGAVNAHDLAAVKAMECSAVASHETQSDIDSIKEIAVTGSAVVTGSTATVDVHITDAGGRSGSTSIDLVDEDGWKVCQAG